MKSICVFCGSNPGRRPEYLSAVQDLAGVLVDQGLMVVYGGAHVGTMGALADAVLKAGGEVIGVITRSLVGAEVAHRGLTRLHVVETMHERKAMMADLSDGFVALPGGLGTLEEFAEMTTWSQLGLHAKPTGLLNSQSFYDPLLTFLDHAVEERFLRPEGRALILSADEPVSLLNLMNAWRPAPTAKWLNADGDALQGSPPVGPPTSPDARAPRRCHALPGEEDPRKPKDEPTQ